MDKNLDNETRARIAAGWATSGLSQVEYAKAVGVSPRAIRQWRSQFAVVDRQAEPVEDAVSQALRVLQAGLADIGRAVDATRVAAATYGALLRAAPPPTAAVSYGTQAMKMNPPPTATPPAVDAARAPAAACIVFLNEGLPAEVAPTGAPASVITAGPPSDDAVGAAAPVEPARSILNGSDGVMPTPTAMSHAADAVEAADGGTDTAHRAALGPSQCKATSDDTAATCGTVQSKDASAPSDTVTVDDVPLNIEEPSPSARRRGLFADFL